jgi:hypothetical protein
VRWTLACTALLMGALAPGCEDAAPNFDFDGDGWDDEQDCGPANALTYPGAEDDWGDGVDQNCDGADGSDHDGDGYPHDAPELSGEWDCDDLDADIGPHAVEVCDGVDNDCDGSVLTQEHDDDGDGFIECGEDEAIDCDDNDVFTFPGAEEACDGQDNDCDGEVGEDEIDADGDGYSGCEGDCDDQEPALTPEDRDGDGFSSCAGDCNDDDPETHPADEDGDGYSICDGDCDDQDPALSIADVDGDGFSTCNGDCRDDNADIHPDAEESCGDGDDNDCDGARDDEDGDCADPPAQFVIAMTLDTVGGGGGGGADVTLDIPLLDDQLGVICEETVEISANFTYGAAARTDYYEHTDEVIAWSSWSWAPSTCPPGWELYRNDPMLEWLWTLHPINFVSCDQVAADAALSDTFVGDDPLGVGTGTFGQYCDTTGPWAEGAQGFGPTEAIWLIPGFEGQLDALGTYTYLVPPSTAHVDVWMIGGLLFADSANVSEPVLGLDGPYQLLSFFPIDNVCMDQVDDDGDGWFDLDDTGCRNIFQPEEGDGELTACSNGIDDDGDGDIDAIDPGCDDGWDEDES